MTTPALTAATTNDPLSGVYERYLAAIARDDQAEIETALKACQAAERSADLYAHLAVIEGRIMDEIRRGRSSV